MTVSRFRALRRLLEPLLPAGWGLVCAHRTYPDTWLLRDTGGNQSTLTLLDGGSAEATRDRMRYAIEKLRRLPKMTQLFKEAAEEAEQDKVVRDAQWRMGLNLTSHWE